MRSEVISDLRWLADQPDGVTHRALLFRAALIIERDATLMMSAIRHRRPEPGCHTVDGCSRSTDTPTDRATSTSSDSTPTPNGDRSG